MKKTLWITLLILVVLFAGAIGVLAADHYNGEPGTDENGSYTWEYEEGLGWIKNYGAGGGGIPDDGAADPIGEQIGYVDDGSGKVPEGLTEPTIETPKTLAFADVFESDWFYSYIKEMVDDKIILGYEDGTIRPRNPITRAEFVTILHRFDGNQAKGSHSFTDCPGKWYQDAISWAHENEIVNGMGNRQFAPNKNITRQEMATIISRYIEHRGFTYGTIPYEPAFADDAKIASWAKGAVYGLKSLGLLTGDNTGMNPTGQTTRAETATMIYRLKYFAGEGYTAS